MRKILLNLLVLSTIILFTMMSVVTGTVSIYTKTLDSLSGTITSYYPEEDKNPEFGDWFYHVGANNHDSQITNGNKPNNLVDRVDGFTPLPEGYNLEDGYVYRVSVTTNRPDHYFGAGFYLYAYASPEHTTVEGISLQLNPIVLVDGKQYTYLEKKYDSLHPDLELNDKGNNSIYDVKENAWKWGETTYTTTFDNVRSLLENYRYSQSQAINLYDSKTMDFMISVKKINNKIRFQVAINDFGIGSFDKRVDYLPSSNPNSKLCVGVKSFDDKNTKFSFDNISIEPYKEIIPYRLQSSIQ